VRHARRAQELDPTDVEIQQISSQLFHSLGMQPSHTSSHS
jgi:hypothetical protein